MGGTPIFFWMVLSRHVELMSHIRIQWVYLVGCEPVGRHSKSKFICAGSDVIKQVKLLKLCKIASKT